MYGLEILTMALALAVGLPIAMFIGYLWGKRQENKEHDRRK